MKTIFVVAILLLSQAVFAQEPVQPVPDVASWATAFANPSLAVVDAWRSENRGCHLARIAVAQGIETLAVSSLKLAIHSPRPCAGCAANGMPSGHTAQSGIGVSRNWAVGISFMVATGALRHEANRHTWPQIAAGAVVGIGSDWLGQRLVKCE